VSTSPPSDKSPVTATFANQSSAPPACPITAYLWTFGNGNTSVLTNPPQQTYLWNGSGNSTTYTITLQVTSSSGTHSTSKTVTVKKP
jgi:PKD repeat protein